MNPRLGDVDGRDSATPREAAAYAASMQQAPMGPVRMEGSPMQPAPMGPGQMQGAQVPYTQPSPQPPKRSVLRSILSFAITIVAIVIVSFLLRTFVFQSYEIPSSSMEETIMTGDLVFSEKVSYYFGDPEPGDIVTFEDPQIPSRTLIKRVIATGGQTIDFRDGNVYIDGERQFEPYTDGKPTYPLQSADSSISYPYTVPEGELWVMGDNRTNSQDSRYFGPVPISSVTGKATLIYWPLDQFGLLD